MRWFIHGSEQPRHSAHFESILRHLDQQGDDEYIFIRPKKALGPYTLQPKSWMLHRLRDIFWDWFSWTPNGFDASDWEWHWKDRGEQPKVIDGPEEHWRYGCSATKGNLPWRPEVILGVSPHEGSMKYHLIPWARRNGIPIVSIDHGLPTQVNPMAVYRSTMMGCDAWACWGEFACEVNAAIGAPRERMVATGSPTIDHLQDVALAADYRGRLGVEGDQRMILLMTTHRDPIKSWADSVFRNVVERYGSDERYRIVVKPHPMELVGGGLIDFGERAIIIEEQTELHLLMLAADVIISPATSVIAPAMAFQKPFIDLLVPDAPGFEGVVDTSLINELLKDAVFHPDQLEAVVSGVIEVDAQACELAFIQLAHSRDGRNGERVASLCRHMAEGGEPWDWADDI